MDGLSRGPPNTAIPSGARYEEIEQESVFQSGLPILPRPRDKNHRGKTRPEKDRKPKPSDASGFSQRNRRLQPDKS